MLRTNKGNYPLREGNRGIGKEKRLGWESEQGPAPSLEAGFDARAGIEEIAQRIADEIK